VARAGGGGGGELRVMGLVGTFGTLLWATPTWGPHLALNLTKFSQLENLGIFY
jgi:hypothetical protein